MITKEELMNIGRNKGLANKEHIEKSYFQDLFLFHLYKESNIFIFKGGTALFKLYNLPRFSEDLDFSLIEGSSPEQAIEIIKKVVSRIEGLSLKDIKKVKNSVLIKVSCVGILTNYNTLRIDLSLKNKLLMGEDIKNYISDYLDIPPFSLKVLNPEELISEKIHSLLNREKARDLYDLFFLLRQFKFNKKIIVEKLKIFGMDYSANILKKRISALGKIWKKELAPFVIDGLPEFESVREYVFGKIE